MASQNPVFKYRADSFFSQPMQFRRKNEKTKTRKIKRKIRLKFRHIFYSFVFFVGLFYGIQRIYLFLISWDRFNVKTVEVNCQNPDIREDITQFFKGQRMGNMFLLNIDTLREKITAHHWIKKVYLRKIFPSSVKIDVKERTPAAILAKENLTLIDDEGVQLQKIDPGTFLELPLFIDGNRFREDIQEKLELAWKCLKSFPLSEKGQIEILDLSEYENVKLKLKHSPTWFILGNDNFADKLRFFHEADLKIFGILEKADLRFPDRLYITPQENISKNLTLSSEKEAN